MKRLPVGGSPRTGSGCPTEESLMADDQGRPLSSDYSAEDPSPLRGSARICTSQATSASRASSQVRQYGSLLRPCTSASMSRGPFASRRSSVTKSHPVDRLAYVIQEAEEVAGPH